MRDMNDPTNVDTIPALLTAGEYVLNKEATQMYGDVIHKMNQHGLQQRHAENKAMGYNTGGLVDFLKKHEGWRDKAYQDSAGIWTIGYGRTFNDDGSPVTKGQTTTKDEEDAWITKRAQQDYDAVKKWADGTGEDYSDKELESLASFRYNLGPGGFNQLTANGTRDKATIRSKLPLYNKAGGRKIDGLVNRRNYELEHAGWGAEPTQQEVPPVEAAVPVPEMPQEQAQQVPPTPPTQPTQEQAEQLSLVEGGFPLGGANGAVMQALSSGLFGGGGAPAGPMPAIGGGQPIKSAQEIRMQRGYNYGGPVHLNSGGWLSNLFGWGDTAEEKTQVASALKRRPGFRSADPLAGTFVDAMDAPPDPTFAGFGRDSVPSVPATPDTLTRPGMAEHVGNRFNFESPTAEYTTDNIYSAPPVSADTEAPGGIMGWRGIDGEGPTLRDKLTGNAPGLISGRTPREKLSGLMDTFVPELDTAPPIPGSDEALLQGSSDTVENLENEVAQMRGEYREMDAVEQGAEFDPRGMNQVPTPEYIPEPPRVPGDTAAPTDGGWASLSPEQFLQEAEAANTNEIVPTVEQQAMSTLQDPNATPEEQALAQQAIATGEAPVQPEAPKESEAKQAHNIPIAEKRAKAEEVISAQQTEPATPEETASAEEAGKNASPQRVEKAKNILQENFGGLFDQKELARAAVLFAGAMLTGASPQKALAIAGQQYMGRLDAKEAQRVKGEQAAQKAMQKGKPAIDMTQSEDFVVDGKKVTGYKMTKVMPDGTKVTDYVGKDGQPIPTSRHQDFARVEGTPEWTAARNADAKVYENIYKDFGQNLKDMGDEIPPGLKQMRGRFSSGLVARQTADWGRRNGVSAEEMSVLMPNVFDQMQRDARAGATINSPEAYLNEQYISAQIPSNPELVSAAPADTVVSIFNGAARRMGLKGSVSEVSESIMPVAKQAWEQLSPEERERYKKRAENTKMTPFLLFMKEDLEV